MLELTGGAIALGLAGCIGAQPEGARAIGAGSNETPETPTEATGATEVAGAAETDETDGADDHGPDGGSHGHEDPHDDAGDHHEEETPEGHTPGEDPHAHEDVGHLHDEPVGDPVDHATVRMVTTETGFHFEPHVARVTPGGTVTFVNESGAHTATAYHPDYDLPLRMPEGAAPWDTGLLTEAGAEVDHTFETEGVYQYYCVPHEDMGMIAAIIVGEPDPHDQPGLEPPGERFSGRAAEKIESLNEMCNEALGHTHD